MKMFVDTGSELEIRRLRAVWSDPLNLSLENVAACEARYCSNLEVNPCLKIVMNGVLVQIFFFYAQVLLSSEINSIMCLLLVFFVQFCS